jgi:hypothetical protein
VFINVIKEIGEYEVEGTREGDVVEGVAYMHRSIDTLPISSSIGE